MRLWILEMKRLIKTRSVRIIASAALFMTAAMALLPVHYVQYAINTPEKGEVLLTGTKALSAIREARGSELIPVTPEHMAKALTQYQEALKQYGNEDNLFFDMPDSEYSRLVTPVSRQIRRLREVYADPDTGIAPSVTELTESDAKAFYEKCALHLTDLMRMEQEKNPSAQRLAAALYSHVKTPFLIYPGVNTDALDYLVLLIFLLVFCCIIIAAPVFSTEYQTGADDILRCTKHGRTNLAVMKIFSALFLVTVLFSVCCLVYVVISNSIFGWESTKASVQILYSAVALLPLTLGTTQALTVLAGLLSMLACVALTLLISSRCKTNISALTLSAVLFLLPLFAYFALPGGQLLNWVQCVFPSGSIGLQNNFAYTLWDFQFLHIGGFSVYLPFAILVFAALETPVFAALTVRSYKRHRK